MQTTTKIAGEMAEKVMAHVMDESFYYAFIAGRLYERGKFDQARRWANQLSINVMESISFVNENFTKMD